jgi:hypothetical protein
MTVIIGEQDKELRQVSVRTQSGEEKVFLDDIVEYIQKI